MLDREKVIKGLECCTFILGKRKCNECPYMPDNGCYQLQDDVHAMLKEQDKKQIKLHKKHVITLKRNDEFSMRKLYESICETLLDEGDLIILRTDDHEKVDFEWEIRQE